MLKQRILSDFQQILEDLKWPKAGVEIVPTSDPKFGDYTTNWALQQYKINQLKEYHSPQEIAKKVVGVFEKKIKNGGVDYLEKVEVAGPGFINFFLKNSALVAEIEQISRKGEAYLQNVSGKGKKARVEFVSANPTGPLHFGNARGGPIGDVLASVLEAVGYQVLREYYNNDVGVQTRKLGESIVNVLAGKPLGEQEYKGEYIKELAKKISKVNDVEEAGRKAVEILSNQAIEDCKEIGIVFDKVYAESEFIKSGQTKQAVDELKKKNFIKENEDAFWFAPNDEFLKDRETVVVKSDGDFTYFASDIAYHKLKFDEDYDLVIDVLGANHHGHVPRLQAAILALGHNVSSFKVILYQWVRFLRGKELAKMSKRAGTLITAREVLEAVGKDSLRFFILMHDPNTPIDFDLDLAKKKSSDNPVYYVQYAHARISSILAKAKDNKSTTSSQGTTSTTGFKKTRDTRDTLKARDTLNPFERNLAVKLIRLPEIIEEISKSFAVHHLTVYVIELADLFHKFYENCRVLDEKDTNTRNFRLQLVDSTGIILRNVLDLLGVSAPKSM